MDKYETLLTNALALNLHPTSKSKAELLICLHCRKNAKGEINLNVAILETHSSDKGAAILT